MQIKLYSGILEINSTTIGDKVSQVRAETIKANTIISPRQQNEEYKENFSSNNCDDFVSKLQFSTKKTEVFNL